ncbi:MAG: hypothetical protein EOS05_10320 [Mesorhizobium sp.]|nr:MAG: hypothetical protein EOS05_10320 [Mesorhizobium sp.]
MDRKTATAIYAKRAAHRASYMPGYTPKMEEPEAAAPATHGNRSHDTLGSLMIGQSLADTKPRKAAMPEASDVYAKRAKEREQRAAA